MEEKKVSKRIKRVFSAGGVVYKKANKKGTDKNRTLWLIIKPKGTDRWQFPKGEIDKGESSEKAALREVQEEGGVDVKLLEKVGISQYFFVLNYQKYFKNVVYYLMEFVSDRKSGHDNEVDEVRFLPFDEAFNNLTFKDDKSMLQKAAILIDKNRSLL